MRSRTERLSLALSCAAALAVAVLFAWLFSRQGTTGLYQWHPDYRRIFILIGAAGLVPLILALLARLLARPLPQARVSRAPGILRVASLSFAGLMILTSMLLFAALRSTAHAVAANRPSVQLVDPIQGIAGREGMVRLSLSSDPHWGSPSSSPEARRKIIKAVASSSPRRDAFFILGDNVEEGMTDASWRAEALDLSQLQGEVPVRSLLGNHDGLIDGQFHFKTYFFPPTMRSDSGSPYYYSMDAGPAKIIVLNLLWGAESFDRRQAAWLERTLAALPQGRQAIVISHCFFYASGYVDLGMPWYDHFGTIAKVAPILERHKVALVVSGHNHYMELLKKNGVSYAVIGAMGGLPDPEPTYRSPSSLWIKQGSFGWLDLDIGDRGIGLAFKASDGSTLHEDFIPAAGASTP